MMIRVVRIAGESYDLETGEQLPKALILSNGLREFSLHVDDATVEAVVEMMGEGLQKPQPQKPRTQKPSAEKAEAIPIARETFGGNGAEASQPTRQAVVADLPDGPVDDAGDDDDLGFEPGEEYDDEATGVGSL